MSRLLEKISAPADLKKLSLPELGVLASELREEIIRVVAGNGGHLAASLGVVELTLALYRTFNLPPDQVIWDVGHQAYAHKLLTGRRDRFPSIRRLKGLSGFPRRSESPYDAFGVGHASTSISAALGLAAARDCRGGTGKVIAVIGDGALTGGLALEALNQGGKGARNTMIVLNANEMAIAPSVGALSGYLNKLIIDPTYNRLKREVEQVLGKIPGVGNRVLTASHRLEEALKGLITPGQIFEEFGYRYIGPVDGHDLKGLLDIMVKVRPMTDPVLLHVVTRKGKGYRPAEENPECFHGLGAFDICSGEPQKVPATLSYSEVFGLTLRRLAEKDARITAVTAAMTLGTGLVPFAHRFPKRIFDVGIAEGHAVTFSAGMAAGGLKPVFAVYSTFLQRAYDQIAHDVCLQGLPVVLALDRAGLVGSDGPTHHGVFDLAFLRHLPGIVVMQPKDGKELAAMIETAFSLDGPAVVRYPRGECELREVPSGSGKVPLGQAEVLAPGRDGWFWALGGDMIGVAMGAAAILRGRGIELGVVNTRFVKPLDRTLLKEHAASGGVLVTLEEHVLQGGLGSAILEALEEEGLRGRVFRFGIPDRFIEHGSIPELREICGLTPGAVAAAVLARLA